MNRSEKIDQYAVALCEAQKVMPSAEKDSVNPYFKSPFSSYEAVVKAIKEPLTSMGICWTHTAEVENGLLIIYTYLIHKSGQWMRFGLPVDPKMVSPQDQGKMITYYKRYGLIALTGCRTGEDDDAESAMTKHRSPVAIESEKDKLMKEVVSNLQSMRVDTQKLDAFIKSRAKLAETSELQILKHAASQEHRLAFVTSYKKYLETIVYDK